AAAHYCYVNGISKHDKGHFYAVVKHILVITTKLTKLHIFDIGNYSKNGFSLENYSKDCLSLPGVETSLSKLSYLNFCARSLGHLHSIAHACQNLHIIYIKVVYCDEQELDAVVNLIAVQKALQ